MPNRTRRVRLRHRPRNEGTADGADADWNAPEASWPDSGGQWVTLTLSPMGEDTLQGMARREYDADWFAVDRRGRLDISDGDRLVSVVDGSDALVLQVVKALKFGRRQVFYLEEKGASQA